ncbi:GNAT family N-acetyltransferase [Pseudoalteromonas fenneropenaei]|uniref:GNAT family N-acetyltransferase n=1 Tax=Pseudoalteromonas fenneropenaei TaxID=1737459 RepID=A0ABV7CMI5_9GAMM
MEIKTLRGALRKATLADAEFIFQLLNQDGFKRFIGDRNIHSISDAKRYIESAFLNSYGVHGLCSPYIFALHDGTALGISGFYHRRALQLPDLGFAFLEQVAGQGYAFEACQAICQFGFEKLQLPRLNAILMNTNHRSRKLLSRLAFQDVGQIIINEDKRPIALMELVPTTS